jgi:non-homologous end joining protein Ku
MAPRANWKGYLRLSLVSCPTLSTQPRRCEKKSASIASQNVHHHAASSSSRAFACFRSNVSKPSVNQP